MRSRNQMVLLFGSRRTSQTYYVGMPGVVIGPLRF